MVQHDDFRSLCESAEHFIGAAKKSMPAVQKQSSLQNRRKSKKQKTEVHSNSVVELYYNAMRKNRQKQPKVEQISLMGVDDDALECSVRALPRSFARSMPSRAHQSLLKCTKEGHIPQILTPPEDISGRGYSGSACDRDKGCSRENEELPHQCDDGQLQNSKCSTPISTSNGHGGACQGPVMLDSDPHDLHAQETGTSSMQGTTGHEGRSQPYAGLNTTTTTSFNGALDELVACWLLLDLDRFKDYLKRNFNHIPRLHDPKHIQQVG